MVPGLNLHPIRRNVKTLVEVRVEEDLTDLSFAYCTFSWAAAGDYVGMDARVTGATIEVVEDPVVLLGAGDHVSCGP